MSLSSPKTPIHQLDGFRAWAIIIVLFYHLKVSAYGYPINLIGSAGWSLVQLFFVLSGFLLSIEYIYNGKNKVSCPSALKFYKKRMARIFPLFFFSMFVYLCYGYVNKSLPSIEDILLHFVFLHNLLPKNSDIYSPYWSLAVEVQVYLLFPLIGYLIHRALHSGKILYLVLLVFFLVAGPLLYRILVTVFYSDYNIQRDYIPLIYSSTISNLDSFAWGIIGALAYVYDIQRRVPVWTGWVGLGISTLIIAGLFHFSHYQNGWKLSFGYFAPSLFYTLLNSAWTMMIVSALILKDSWVNIFFANKIFHFISLISYSMYIWHLRVFGLVRHTLILTGMNQAVWQHELHIGLTFLLTICLSTLTYYWIELPFMKLGKGEKPWGGNVKLAVFRVRKIFF